MRPDCLLLMISLAALSPAQDRRLQHIVARKQVALVIGNAAYANQPLRNPVHDAQAIAGRLRELNFDVVLVTDASRKAMGLAIDQFVGRLGAGDVAFFYYAGHGVQVDGENYLIPVDFQGQNETDVRYDAHSAGRIQERMERSGAQLNILVLDACRNNPYRSGMRGGTDGLAAMSPGRGTFIAFATAPGHTAGDNPSGRNGLFTQYLLEALSVGGLGLDDVFNLVRERVDAASASQQLPWSLSSVVGRYSFLPGEAAPAPAVTAPAIMGHAPQPGDAKVNPKDGQSYVWIPPGKFTMGCSPRDNQCSGDEKPPHAVEITKGFWLGQTQVTVGAWKKYARAIGGMSMPPEPKFGDRSVNPGWLDDRQPIVNINWEHAAVFCGWSGGRLPTEAEWEYAARAGTTRARYGDLDETAWYGHIDTGANAKDDVKTYDVKTYVKLLNESGNGPHAVGLKQPNAWKLYDMLGNVWQWTADLYGDKYYEQREGRDPIGPQEGRYRALRGGSWYNVAPSAVRASSRYKVEQTVAGPFMGFRCAEN